MTNWSPEVDERARSLVEKRKRERAWSDITGITLHQTGVHGFPAKAWYKVTCHLGVHSDGRVFWVHPLTSLLYASNAFNRDTVAIEVAGNYRGDEERPDSYWKKGGGPSQLDQPMSDGLRRAIRFIMEEAASAGGRITHVYGHRQACRGKTLCPGAQIWRAGGVWAQAELGLSNGPPGYTRSDGRPIPQAWDPSVPPSFGLDGGDDFDFEASAAEGEEEFPDDAAGG